MDPDIGLGVGKVAGPTWTQPALPDPFIDPMDWMQEYHCLLTLEGLQALVGQCLYRLQELRTGETLTPTCAEVWLGVKVL